MLPSENHFQVYIINNLHIKYKVNNVYFSFLGIKYHGGAKTLTYKVESDKMKLPGTVALVIDQTADRQISDECQVLCAHLGCYTFKLDNISVNNMHKLMHATKSKSIFSLQLIN